MPSPDFTIEIKGLDTLKKRLYEFSDKLGDKVVLDSLKRGATLIRDEARRNAPVRTGRLKKAIVVKLSKIYSKRKRRYTGKLGVYVTIRKGKGRNDTKDGFYGRFVEDGYNARGVRTARINITRAFGKRTGRKTARSNTDVAGKKFIKRAFRSKKVSAVNLTVKAAERGADVIARRVGL